MRLPPVTLASPSCVLLLREVLRAYGLLQVSVFCARGRKNEDFADLLCAIQSHELFYRHHHLCNSELQVHN